MWKLGRSAHSNESKILYKPFLKVIVSYGACHHQWEIIFDVSECAFVGPRFFPPLVSLIKKLVEAFLI